MTCVLDYFILEITIAISLLRHIISLQKYKKESKRERKARLKIENLLHNPYLRIWLNSVFLILVKSAGFLRQLFQKVGKHAPSSH
jgi:hypothetical protein